MIKINGVDTLTDSLKENYLEVQKIMLKGLTTIDKALVLKINLKLLILSNITQISPGISQFLQLAKPDYTGLNFSMLFEWFVSP